MNAEKTWALLPLFALCCSQPAPERIAPAPQRSPAIIEPSMRAPFVLRLEGPAAPPLTAGQLDLVAVLETPPSTTSAMPIDLEVETPSGVTLRSGAVKQRITVGAASPRVSLPLSFIVPGGLRAAIVVRATFRAGDAMGATAERRYPEPAAAPATDPVGGDASVRRIGGLPIGTPQETTRIE